MEETVGPREQLKEKVGFAEKGASKVEVGEPRNLLVTARVS